MIKNQAKTCEATKVTAPSRPPLLTIRDVAERLQVSCRTIHRLVGNGDLTVIHIGRSVRISEEALKAFLTGADKP